MLYLIIGGSGSGKSSIAEEICHKLSPLNKAYIATMKPYGEETLKRIEKHRSARKDKGFTTIEKYENISDCDLSFFNCVLIECMGNLVLNQQNEKDIVKDILKINSRVKDVVVVSNNVFCDGMDYEDFTLNYTKRLSYVNCEISKYADVIIEAVYGIKVYLKEGKYENNK